MPASGAKGLSPEKRRSGRVDAASPPERASPKNLNSDLKGAQDFIPGKPLAGTTRNSMIKVKSIFDSSINNKNDLKTLDSHDTLSKAVGKSRRAVSTLRPGVAGKLQSLR